MSKHLLIKNFGPIKDAKIELKAFNLLIGEQSRGKSTIAKLIAILTDNYSLAFISQTGIKAWKIQLRMYDLEVFQDDNYHINYDIDENSIIYHLEIEPKNVVSYIEKDGKIITKKEDIARQLILSRKFYHEDSFFESLKKARNDKANNSITDVSKLMSYVILVSSSLYIPAERIIFSLFNNLQSAINLVRGAIPATFLRFMVHLENAKSSNVTYNSDLLDITYLSEKGDSFFIDHKCERKFSMAQASSGIQSSIPLILLLEDIKNREFSSIVIEEPETNLFPNMQVELLKLIILKSLINEDRIATVTTHSPYLLSAINNILFAGNLVFEYGSKISRSVNSIIPKEIQLNTHNCSVYSIGEEINNGQYCVSLIDKETGLIDFNTLDIASDVLGVEFSKLENLYSKMLRK